MLNPNQDLNNSQPHISTVLVTGRSRKPLPDIYGKEDMCTHLPSIVLCTP